MPRAARQPPRYLTLADEFLRRIESGEFAPGSQFPSEFEICAEYAVSRHTARAALARLHEAGMLARRPGSGTRVTAPEPPLRLQRGVESLDELLLYPEGSRIKMLRCERVPASQQARDLLLLRAGARVLRLYGLRLAEGESPPICCTEALLRPTRDLPASLQDPARAAEALREVLTPRRMSRVEQQFDAVALGAVAARDLQAAPGSAALRICRRYIGADGRPVGAAISLHPAGRFAYPVTLERRSPV